MGWGRGLWKFQEGRDMCVLVANSHYCMAEANTISSNQNFKKEKKSREAVKAIKKKKKDVQRIKRIS